MDALCFHMMMASTGIPALADVYETMQNTPPVIGVRRNKRKKAVDFDGASVPWCDEGLCLSERPNFTLDPALHQGRYYVQDPSAMAHAAAVKEAYRLIGEQPNVRYLDACAAPGGKTTAAIDILPEDATIVANEYEPTRITALEENVVKWGAPNVIVTRADAAAFKGLDEYFDIITADVPCSGEGMMRKDSRAVEQWSEDLVRQCAYRQRQIVDNLWGKLRSGGLLIYSTCTFNNIENEEIVEHLIKEYDAEVMPVPDLERAEIVHNLGYRLIPGLVQGEGQFIALLRKGGNPLQRRETRSARPNSGTLKSGRIQSLNRLLNGATLRPFNIGNEIYALPENVGYAEVSASLRVKYAGVRIGVEKGKDFVPDHALAMSSALRDDAFIKVDVSRDTALEYLRKNPICLPADTPKGFVLLTYEDVPLGFVKHLGNRSNNLYPLAWRVKI